jgi:hypothetical protein
MWTPALSEDDRRVDVASGAVVWDPVSVGNTGGRFDEA